VPVENSSDIYILSIYISVEPEAHATQIVGQMPVWKWESWIKRGITQGIPIDDLKKNMWT
jgi:hypothetical protein